ncbi:hypothetical protein C475_06035 [Halosimplex carlsbadense 2-9-1]|uniref:Archaeal Type IV pilin N-terminal domain-containing protein n=1 Tax=Halosimplex carlsbadense 2-9-1 TaxID=797114 RepID=M0CW76_9EURY|nr:archaellin/type IV pilin N-terminal domain-containing protein [Halosimplex carlsbadense]ELZ27455.1 hypothetical protein C475_06035 [Halosimplex carlsbadense 2-9-1]
MFGDAEDGAREDRERGVTSVLSVVLLVAVTLVVSMVLVVGALTFLPSDGEESVRPGADFGIERDDGAVVVDPQYMEEGVPFTLLVNGREAYSWDGGNTEEARRLRCLNEGDTVRVRADAGDDRTYLIEDHDVRAPTACDFSGSAARFAYAQVGSRQVPLADEGYEFTLAIDPDGPNSVVGDTDFPTTNPWVYVERYDRTLEGVGSPVYVVVFPDNVGSVTDWRSPPSDDERAEMADAFEVDGDEVRVTPGAVEPTDDVYMLFEPGCSESRFKFLRMDGGYNNQILIDGTELFRTDDAAAGQIYTGPGVDCT